MTKVTRHIRAEERVATALSQLLPADVRDDLRRRKVPAKEVIALFELDHVRFHTWAEDETVNEWWNLTYLEKHVHREKTRIDQGKIAKVRRRAKREALEKAQAKVQEVLLGKRWDKKPDNKPKWKRKINGKTVRVDANGKEL